MKLAGLRGGMEAAKKAGLPRLFELEVEYEEGACRRMRKFVTSLIEDIEAGALEGVEMWKSFHADGEPTWRGGRSRVRY